MFIPSVGSLDGLWDGVVEGSLVGKLEGSQSHKNEKRYHNFDDLFNNEDFIIHTRRIYVCKLRI